VQQTDLHEVMWRLFQEQAEFAVGDLIEIERPQGAKLQLIKIRVIDC
jgi:hypothetical protein